MELTPELFEKIEFAERRRGYDTEQVETFLEQAGTALAQMLARVRHTEERAAHADSRLAEAEQKLAHADQVLAEADRRVQQAEQRLQQAASGVTRASEEAEVEQAAKTLLMARRTAEATVNEARGQAQSLLEDARSRAERQLGEANAEAEELLRRAAERAEAEYADRRAEAVEEVQALESRRSQLGDVIAQLEARLAGYREDLVRAAEELVSLADDPGRLGSRPTMSLQADEVLRSEPVHQSGAADPEPVRPAEEHVAGEPMDDEPMADEPVAVDPEPAESELADEPASAEQPSAGGTAHHDLTDPGGRGGSGEPVARGGDAGAPASRQPMTPQVSGATRAGEATGQHEPVGQHSGSTRVLEDRVLDDEPGERTEYLDLTAGSADADVVSAEDRWGPGSWADLQAELETELETEPESADRVGTHRDRFMEELDSAVNEAVELDDDAMKAFFEGTSDSRARRFGWRR